MRRTILLAAIAFSASCRHAPSIGVASTAGGRRLTSYPSTADLPMPCRIWLPWDEPAPRVFLARRRFALRLPSTGGTAYVSSIGSYQAWIDGRPLAVPATKTPSWWRMHRLALPALAQGEHVMAVRIDVPKLPQPFLMVCIDNALAAGGICRTVTDPSWKLSAQDRAGFERPDYGESDADGWRDHAWAFDGAWAEPWGMPTNGPEDFARFNTGTHRVEEETLGRVVEREEGLGAWLSIDETKLAARPFYTDAPDDPEIEWGGLRNMYHLVREDVFKRFNEWMDPHEARCPRVTYDLGAETFGRLRLRNRGAKKCWVVARFAESLGELEKYNRRHGELYPIDPGESVETKMTGCRYARVIVLAGKGADPVALDAPVFQHVLYDLERVGSFECSDPLVTRIWDAAARTIHLCLHEEIWDAPKRDLLPWAGDFHLEALSAHHVFGCDPRRVREPVRRTLRVLRELGPDPVPPLASSPAAGIRNLWREMGGHEMNGVASYTMWWVIALYDHWRYSGDVDLVRELAPGLPAILDRIAKRVDAQGRWVSPAKDWGSNYVDWANLPYESSSAAIHVLGGMALERGAALLRVAGRTEVAKDYERTAESMRRYFQERMVDRSAGLVIMPEGDPKKPPTPEGRAAALRMHHANAIAIEARWLTGDAAERSFRGAIAMPMAIHYTPWWRYHDLEAAARCGHVTWGLDMLRDIWGGMLKSGATTFWEMWDPAYSHSKDPHAVAFTTESVFGYGGYRASLCHGWSSGPAVWLHTVVLGVRPIKNGFEEFAFDPDLGDLAWARGEVPTPRGPIRVSLRKLPATLGKRLAGDIEIPVGLEAATSHPRLRELGLRGPCKKSFDVVIGE